MRTTLLFCLLCFAFFPRPVSAQNTLFTNLSSKETGIDFRNDISETENLNVLAYEYFYNGAAVAVGDINNDGLLDVFFTANMKNNKLFLNQGNLKFKDITRQAHPLLAGKTGSWKTGATMADVNGDGLLDIYICYSGKTSDELRRNQLFINKGNLQFEEKAKEYGVYANTYSTQAAFFDYDNDGDLDLFLLNHNVKKIDNMELAKFRNQTDSLAGNRLYENRNNRFVDVSAEAGINQFPLTFGLGICIADINKDGWEDIYVTNDYNEQDYLYLNNKDKTFTESSKLYFQHMSHFSMGVDIADFNNDGLPDLYTLDMLPADNKRQKLLQLQENYESFELMQTQGLHKQYMRNMLQLNNGNGTFSEIGQVAGISNTDWSWCPLFADFDNDGYKDLFVTNGYFRDYTNKDFLKYWGDFKIKKAMDREPLLLMDLIKAMPVTYLSNYIYKNNGDLSFTEKKQEWGITKSGHSNGAVYADLDNDGDLDLIVNNLNAEASILRNNARQLADAPHYIALSLKYKDKNPFAIGAKVYLYSKVGSQYQEVNPNRGYLSCVSSIIHFGVGKQERVDSIRIIWPDNTTQLIINPAVDQQLKVDYTKTVPAPTKPTLSDGIFVNSIGQLNYKHSDFIENNFKRQPLMLFMYSKVGPVITKADVNKDGKEDLFISGDKNKPGKIYLQTADGRFTPVPESNLGDENLSITAAASFLDANGDGNPDIYIAKGGYSIIEPGTAPLQDELFVGDGKGNFKKSEDALPSTVGSSKSCVAPYDFDGDGDIDLFVGGKVIPGLFPVTPRSYLLSNDGKGKFSVVNTLFDSVGLVSDAKWFDINKDGRKDLLICGEFMPIKVFINGKTGFSDQTSLYFEGANNGFWYSLEIADIDGDGIEEIIAGNLGLNNQFNISEKQPAELYYADFDKNGSIDPFFNYYIEGVSYPYVSRDELNEQMYVMRKKFLTYKDYAPVTMQQLFSASDLAAARKLEVNESRTVVYFLKNGKYVKKPLPLPAQFSMVTKIKAADFDKDGLTDILLLGNHSDNRLKIGSIDANTGCLLKGDGKGGFSYVSQSISGLNVKGDVKSLVEVIINGQKFLVIGSADESIKFYQER